MLYLANASTPGVREAMTRGEIGMITTPNEGRLLLPGVPWAADNGCFSTNYVGDARWLAWLTGLVGHADRCLFAAAPDVVGDAVATLGRSAPFLPLIRDLGYPAALVAQDGLENLDVPWETFDVLFIGGTTVWKLGRDVTRLVAAARARGRRVHMGRVNSRRRFLHAEYIGCHTADGTLLAFGPDTNLRRVENWNAYPRFDFWPDPA